MLLAGTGIRPAPCSSVVYRVCVYVRQLAMSKRMASYECSRSSLWKRGNCHGNCSTESSSPLPDVHTYVRVCTRGGLLQQSPSIVSFEKCDCTPAIDITLWLIPRVINLLMPVSINAGSKTS